MLKQYTIDATTITTIAEYEERLYDLRKSETMRAGMERELGCFPSDISYIVAFPEDRSMEVHFHNKERAPVHTAAIDEDGKVDEFINSIYLLTVYGGISFNCLQDTPLWYKYYIFRYLALNCETMDHVLRFKPDDFEVDTEICILHSMNLHGEASDEMRLPRAAIRRERYELTADKNDEGIGELHPIMIVGNKFGFNQMVTMPHKKLKFDVEHDIEMVITRDLQLYTR